MRLWMPISVFSIWSLLERGRRIFLDSGYYCALLPGPKRAGRIHRLFSLSREDDVFWYVVREPLNKADKNKNAQGLVSCCSSITNISVVLKKKKKSSVLRKIRKKLQNMQNFWWRQWRGPKKNARNRLLRDRDYPLWEILSLSLSPVKNELF